MIVSASALRRLVYSTRMCGLASLCGFIVAVLAAVSPGDDAPRAPSKAGALTDRETSASSSGEAPGPAVTLGRLGNLGRIPFG